MMRASSTNPTLYLIDQSDIKRGSLPDDIQGYLTHAEVILNWAYMYLCQSHDSLGRMGPVCPFAQPSLNKALFWLTFLLGRNPELEKVGVTVMQYGEWFLELDPKAGKEAQYKAILILFPDLAPVRTASLIDTIHSTLKPTFVKKGIMIGQFYAGCNEPGIWNRDFRPLRAPVPLLAIRHMVPTDFPFLMKDAGWLTAYLERFGHAVPNRLRAAVREAVLEFGLEYPDK